MGMTMNTSHKGCLHPSTSTARAKCRKDRATRSTAHREELDAIIATYYDNSADIEDIAANLHTLGVKAGSQALIAVAMGYYDNSLEIEVMIYDATTLRHTL